MRLDLYEMEILLPPITASLKFKVCFVCVCMCVCSRFMVAAVAVVVGVHTRRMTL